MWKASKSSVLTQAAGIRDLKQQVQELVKKLTQTSNHFFPYTIHELNTTICIDQFLLQLESIKLILHLQVENFQIPDPTSMFQQGILAMLPPSIDQSPFVY